MGTMYSVNKELFVPRRVNSFSLQGQREGGQWIVNALREGTDVSGQITLPGERSARQAFNMAASWVGASRYNVDRSTLTKEEVSSLLGCIMLRS